MAKRLDPKAKKKGDGITDEDRRLLEAADGDPLIAAGLAEAEAEIASSPREIARWHQTSSRLQALADVATAMPFMAGGPSAARVQQASALTEVMTSQQGRNHLEKEKIVMDAYRGAQAKARAAEIASVKERMEALPTEFRQRLGLLARIDGRAATGISDSGMAIAGGGAGLVEQELPICQMAVDVAKICATAEVVDALVAALRDVPSDFKMEIIVEKAGEGASSWKDMVERKPTHFAKACRLAVAWLRKPESVLLLENPARVAPSVAARVADKGLVSFGMLTPALAAAEDGETPMDRRLAGALPIVPLLAAPEAPEVKALKKGKGDDEDEGSILGGLSILGGFVRGAMRNHGLPVGGK